MQPVIQIVTKRDLLPDFVNDRSRTQQEGVFYTRRLLIYNVNRAHFYFHVLLVHSGALGCLLTDCDGVVDFKAAQHLVDVPAMEEPVAPHHHLESLCLHTNILDP